MHKYNSRKIFIKFFLVSFISLIGFTYSPSAQADDTPTFTRFTSVLSCPVWLITSHDGNSWFTRCSSYDGINSIGRITPSGDITDFALPSKQSANAITAGPDGNVWFTGGDWSTGDRMIGRITPNGTITQFPLSNANTQMDGITTGPDGNVWFTEDSSSGTKIGRITPTGTITEFPLPITSSPRAITAGPDGNVWFTTYRTIGRITPTGTITEFQRPAGSWSYDITTGPDGNLWFTEVGENKIGRITPTGTITEFIVPTANSGPWGITTGPDGNLWFTEQNGNKIGKITPSGTITEFSIPTDNIYNYPYAITTGSDDNLWFTESGGSSIVKFNPSGTIITQTPTPTPPTPTITPTRTPLNDSVYVALGDSFSAGEGNEPFFEAYSTCHRSKNAYSTLVKMQNLSDSVNYGKTYFSLKNTPGYSWGFNACSGDKIKDVEQTQLTKNADPTNRNFLKLDAKTKLVTITIGGNDLDFSKILKFCAVNHTNCANDKYKNGKTLKDWVKEEIPVIEKKLVNLYKKIHELAPNAQILVLGYPQLFPATFSEQNCAQLRQYPSVRGKNLGFSSNEQNYMRSATSDFNSAIERAVKASNIYHLEFLPVATDFAGHEVCGSSGSWINGATVTFKNGVIKDFKVTDQSFHPTEAGQAKYAEIVNKHLSPIPEF